MSRRLILQALHDKGVDLFLPQQGLDTSTSAGRAMFQMLGVLPSLSGASFAMLTLKVFPMSLELRLRAKK
jgi:hypothetical protein